MSSYLLFTKVYSSSVWPCAVRIGGEFRVTGRNLIGPVRRKPTKVGIEPREISWEALESTRGVNVSLSDRL